MSIKPTSGKAPSDYLSSIELSLGIVPRPRPASLCKREIMTPQRENKNKKLIARQTKAKSKAPLIIMTMYSKPAIKPQLIENPSTSKAPPSKMKEFIEPEPTFNNDMMSFDNHHQGTNTPGMPESAAENNAMRIEGAAREKHIKRDGKTYKSVVRVLIWMLDCQDWMEGNIDHLYNCFDH
uniref:Uncharacterized protein n=1 Tax=Caenorhabditis tropicalis TaxID=1561998 RepID=A0A1I7U227_9PELO